MNVKDCILAKAAAGLVDGKKAQEVAERFDEIFDDLGDVERSWHDRQRAAAASLDAEIRRKLERRKRMRLRQAQAFDRIRQRAAQAPEAVDQAMLSLLDFDPRGRVHGLNVSNLGESIRGMAQARAADFFQAYRSKAAGLVRRTAGLEDVVRELFGEASGSAEAKPLAGGISEAFGYLRARFNTAGGDIGLRKDFGLPQGHNREAIARTAKREWIEFTKERLDFTKMRGPDGESIGLRGVLASLDALYDDIVSGGLNEVAPVDPRMQNTVARRTHHRFMIFRDAESWLQYQEKFGNPDIFATITAHIDSLARDTATMEVLGPYPERAIEFMESLVDQAHAKGAISMTGKAAAASLGKVGAPKTHLRDTFNVVTGKLNRPANSAVASISQANRNILVSALLGGAWFSSLSDLAIERLAAKMVGLPFSKVLGSHLKMFATNSTADRLLAARLGFGVQGWASHAIAAQRLFGEVTGPDWSARIADTVLRASFLSPWTESGRFAFQTEMLGMISDLSDRALADLPDPLKRTFGRHGIDAATWDRIRFVEKWADPENGEVRFLRPEDVARHQPGDVGLRDIHAQWQAANLLSQMIFIESKFAIIETTPRVRALLTAGKPAGSFWGEVARDVALFKSFPVTMMHMHLSRGLNVEGMSKGNYFAQLVIGTTIMGGLAMQLKEVAKGRDPRAMDSPKFWGAAFIQGGGAGLFGDFLYSSGNRYGGGLTTALAGPVAAQISGAANAVAGNVRRAFQDKETRTGRDLSRFAQGMIPGGRIWYGRLALERLVYDEIDRLIDPDAPQRFRRIEERARREFGQKFFWRPGKAAPERGPDLTAVAP